MSKKCARCEKTVYPIEELKCLDKIWHKLCFKCQACGMTLNMRNYKGFNKQPYCEAHIPKAKATTMAETPELKRIAENTKIQSNVQYHAEFERAKGKFTQVADDPETLRIKQNSKIISNVAYHGELEKKAAMEKQRGMRGENGERGVGPEDAEDPAGRHLTQLEGLLPPPPAQQHNHHPHQPPPGYAPPPQPQHQPQPPPSYAAPPPPQPQPQHHQLAAALGEPAVRSSPYSARQSATLIYTSDRGPVSAAPSRPVGSIADLDPVNDYYGSLSADLRGGRGAGSGQAGHHGHAYANNSHQPAHHPQQQMQQQQQQQRGAAPANHAPPHSPAVAGRNYRAMYDYDAQDEDEVSFRDGDLITNCTPIDEGWMTGLVHRTGVSGMLPANYVEPAN